MYLYKFSNIEIDKLACLQSNLIWFAALQNCNDPFEGNHIFYDIEDEAVANEQLNEIISYFVSGVSLSAKELEEQNKEKLIEIGKRGLLSMSLHCDQKKTELNNLMWSHYADGMKGYCLKFNKEEFINSIYKTNDNDSVEGLYCKSVDYVKDTPQINWLRSDKIRSAIFSKSDHWKYENEYRLTSSSTGKHSYDPGSLKEIIIGNMKMNID